MMMCRRCGHQMKPSKAIDQTWTGEPEWPGATLVTLSPGGPGKLIDCLKCVNCGHSISSSTAKESSERSESGGAES